MVGGETSFPRWVNAETFLPLNVKPEKGKAVLFYSQLPDGNLDDFSHHAALPVTEGEKVCCVGTCSVGEHFCFVLFLTFHYQWLMNLWVWDPIYE
jgi:prolyl 4-hydroxylase